jgi:hypothetical protein
MMAMAVFPRWHITHETLPPADPHGLAAAALMIAVMVVCFFFLRRWRWIP